MENKYENKKEQPKKPVEERQPGFQKEPVKPISPVVPEKIINNRGEYQEN